MKGGREELRQGKTIKLEDGRSARLNPEKKTLELSDGDYIEIPKNEHAHMFPSSEKELSHARRVEKHESEIASKPLGEFRHELGSKGIAGATKKWLDKAALSKEDYESENLAREEISERIGRESPWTSRAASVGSAGLDLLATLPLGGSPAAIAGGSAALSLAHAGPKIVEDPSAALKEAAISGVLGYGVGHVAQGVGRVASRRSASRALPAQRDAVMMANAEREAELLEENAPFVAEHAAKTKAYESEIAGMPAAEEAAKQNFTKNVVANAEKVGQQFPSGESIEISDLSPSEFINQQIDKSILAATPEGSKAKKIINSLFPEEESIAGNELSKRYEVLESIIQKSDPEVQKVLINFKEHLGNKLSAIIRNDKISKILAPNIVSQFEKAVDTIGSKLNITQKHTLPSIKKEIQDVIGSLDTEVLQSGSLSKKIINDKIKIDQFVPPGRSPSWLNKMEKGVKLSDKQSMEKTYIYDPAVKEMQAFKKELKTSIDQIVKDGISSAQGAVSKGSSFETDIQGTYGHFSDLPKPPTPTPPTMDPRYQQFTETPLPELPIARGGAQKMGDVFERGIAGSVGDVLGKGKGLGSPTVKLAALKYLFGKPAMPTLGAAAAGYAGLKGLTSPSMAGEAARLTFRQGGIEAIISWASEYPSYHDGIVENPQEKRSLNREIENAQDIPLEQKAMIQSKINRGKPIDQKL
jgi:hypothetical protein